MYKKTGIVLVGTGVFAALTGLILHYLGFNLHESSKIPIYAPFFGIGKFCFLLGGLLIILGKEKIDDEFIKNLKLKAFKNALIITAIVVVANESLYFFTDKFLFSAADLLIAQIWLQFFIFKYQLRQAGLK